MEHNIQVLDCTLREAPVDNLCFGDFFIKKFIEGLENSGTDIIEIGFLKNEKHKKGSTIFQRVEEIEPYIDKKLGIKYVALIDYGRYDVNNLAEYSGKSIDGIRICFKKGEQEGALQVAQQIKEKGYLVCIQHVDTLGYTDEEITSFILKVNKLKPYAYSIVDTFGAMYQDDLAHLYTLVDEKLDPDIHLGFHAHNNLMLADANAQTFIENLSQKRKVIVDSSVYGCGRGAGNAHTEQIMQFINLKHTKKYNMDNMLDLMDDYIPVLQNKATWGYNIPYFIAGMYKSHVYNVDYLLSRHNIKSKDLREIIENLDEKERRLYDYPKLEQKYVEHFDRKIDDKKAREILSKKLESKDVLLIAPGKSISEYEQLINVFIDEKKPYVIEVNNIIKEFKYDSIFFSSNRRYREGLGVIELQDDIWVTSNINKSIVDNALIFNYYSLIKFGWINIDNACILLLRLLLQCGVKHIYLAGFDGYRYEKNNFYHENQEKVLSEKTIDTINREIKEMLIDIINEYGTDGVKLEFITPSIYEENGDE